MEDWLTEHWATLLAALGLGGGSSVVGHKMVDKIQNKKIDKLEAKVNEIDSSFKVNDGVDKQFRKEVDTRLGNIETSLSTLTNHLLSKKNDNGFAPYFIPLLRKRRKHYRPPLSRQVFSLFYLRRPIPESKGRRRDADTRG